MVYRFKKSDEGKCFFYSFWLKDNYCEHYSHILKVSKKAVAYRRFFFIEGLESKFIKKYPDVCCWRYEVAEIDNNDFPDNTICLNPLRLVMLGCLLPKKDLTEDEVKELLSYESADYQSC